MKLRSVLFITLALVLTAALVMPAPASAQEEGFTETFEVSDPAGWELHPESASILDGVLQISPGGYALHFGDWSEISLSLRINFSGEGQAVVGYYHRDQGAYSLVIAAGSLVIEKMKDGSSTVLGNASLPSLQPDTWQEILLTVASGQHQVYVAGELALSSTDPHPLETGAILLASRGAAGVEFDDLELRGTPGSGGPPEQEPVVQEEQTAAEVPATTAAEGADGGRSLLADFFSSQASTIELTDFLFNLLLAAVCAYILGIVYAHWGTSLSNRRKFASNFLLMTVTTTFIIMVVRSSVALSLGLVGALSIVRFRSAVKEPEELAYLFFALGIGIGLGDNQRLITLVAMAAGIALLGLRALFRRSDADVNLHVSVASHSPAEVPLERINETLAGHCSKVKLVRYDETASQLEAAYLVELRRMDQLNALRSALKSLSPSLEITFLDNKGIW